MVVRCNQLVNGAGFVRIQHVEICKGVRHLDVLSTDLLEAFTSLLVAFPLN